MKPIGFLAIIMAFVNIALSHKVWLENDVRAHAHELLVSRLERQADNFRHEAEMAELDRKKQLRMVTVSTKVGP